MEVGPLARGLVNQYPELMNQAIVGFLERVYPGELREEG